MTARDVILDAAALVMSDLGIARATTKEIARAAGYSEALLYKHFADKRAIYLAVLKERTPGPAAVAEPGTDEVVENLIEIAVGLMEFYVQSFPMSAWVFSDRDLLIAWRDGMTARGAGPRGPVRTVERYLAGESALGRIPNATDVGAVAAILCGAMGVGSLDLSPVGLAARREDQSAPLMTMASVSGYTVFAGV